MGKRSNRNEFSFAVGHPEGPRSLGWRVWSNRNSSDVYMRTVRGQDVKVSLHDPYAAKTRLPWNFGATPEWMTQRNHSGQTHKNIVEWGPYGGYPPGVVAAVEVVVPTSDLWTSDHAVELPASTYWHPPGGRDDGATSFVVAFLPPGHHARPDLGKLLWFHRLANGHRVALTVQDVELTTFARETMRSKREVGLEGFLRDLESGGIELPEAPGRHGFSVLHALPPVGHLVTVLEFKGISYWAPGD